MTWVTRRGQLSKEDCLLIVEILDLSRLLFTLTFLSEDVFVNEVCVYSLCWWQLYQFSDCKCSETPTGWSAVGHCWAVGKHLLAWFLRVFLTTGTSRTLVQLWSMNRVDNSKQTLLSVALFTVAVQIFCCFLFDWWIQTSATCCCRGLYPHFDPDEGSVRRRYSRSLLPLFLWCCLCVSGS